MKILNIKLYNFIPYYDQNEIVLFKNNIKNRNITINIGPTGNGKTSISRAIMWCLFGEAFDNNWEAMLNDLALEVHKKMREKTVKMSVEIEVEVEEKVYQILRTGKYDLHTGKREKDTEFSIRKEGKIVDEPEGFVSDNFPPLELMRYFIFDADDMLSLFERNQEQTIKDHINKIVGVATLDKMLNILENVIPRYENDIDKFRSMSPDVSNQEYIQEKKIYNTSKLAIEKIREKIQECEIEKKKLIPGGKLTPQEENLKSVMDEEQEIEADIKKLNTKLEENKELINNIHLLFLKEIIGKSIEILNTTNTTEEEFNSAIHVIRSTLEDNYNGLIFDGLKTMLIPKKKTIDNTNLVSSTNLDLGHGSGIKVNALSVLQSYKAKESETRMEFFKMDKDLKQYMKRYLEVRNKLRQIGNTQRDKKIKEKIDKFLEYENKKREFERILKSNQEELISKEERIKELERENELAGEYRQDIEKIQKKIVSIKNMVKYIKETKREFLKNLLKDVNHKASEFFRGVVKANDPRLYAVEVDSDYKLNFKSKRGDILEPSTISKGNTQIALMAFFFGLSQYLKHKLPYVIDDPLIRLDPGHDKRLINHLCKNEQQIIMHMIPGKEYTQESFQWLKPFINTQNWISRDTESTNYGSLKSKVQNKEPASFIKYDLDKL